MQALSHAPAALLVPARVERRAAVSRARVEASPLFEEATRRRGHDGIALGVAVLLVSTMVGLGVWMTMEVADGLAIASLCDGKCVPAAR
jgi:hypothetical protein